MIIPRPICTPYIRQKTILPSLCVIWAVSSFALYKAKDDTAKPLRDLGRRELSLLGVLVVGLIWLGLYPQPVLDKSKQAMHHISTKMPNRYSDVDGAIAKLKGNQKPILPDIMPEVINIKQGANE